MLSSSRHVVCDGNGGREPRKLVLIVVISVVTMVVLVVVPGGQGVTYNWSCRGSTWLGSECITEKLTMAGVLVQEAVRQ